MAQVTATTAAAAVKPGFTGIVTAKSHEQTVTPPNTAMKLSAADHGTFTKHGIVGAAR